MGTPLRLRRGRDGSYPVSTARRTDLTEREHADHSLMEAFEASPRTECQPRGPVALRGLMEGGLLTAEAGT
jgi:hypothetical protein